MGREKKNQNQAKEPSLRDKIKAFRRELHGEVAAKFDETFIDSCGYGKSFKEALQEGENLQKSFVAAKKSIEGMVKPKAASTEDDD